jgi:hypothetical protein
VLCELGNVYHANNHISACSWQLSGDTRSKLSAVEHSLLPNGGLCHNTFCFDP